MSSTRFSLPRVLPAILLSAAATFALPALAQEATPDAAPATSPEYTLPEGVQVVGGDEAALTSLLLRSSANLYGYFGDADETLITFYPAQVPDDLPVTIPLPEDAEIIGTVTRVEFQDTGTIYLNSTQSGEALLSFYREALTQPDWEEGDASFGPAGFVTRPAATTFCNDEDDVVNINAVEAEGSTDAAPLTYLTLSYQLDSDFDPCDPSQMSGMGIQQLIPGLQAPEGVRIGGLSGGGGGSNNDYYYASNLRTELSLGELLAAYAPQLEALDWTSVETVETESLAVSTWTFTVEPDPEDEDAPAGNFLGMITLSRFPGSEDVYAIIRVVAED